MQIVSSMAENLCFMAYLICNVCDTHVDIGTKIVAMSDNIGFKIASHMLKGTPAACQIMGSLT